MISRGESVGTIAGVRIAGPGSELMPVPGPYDVVIDRGIIADIAPAGALRPRGAVLDAQGAFLIPGLWDHHVHTVQWALAAQRTWIGDAASAAEVARTMSHAAVLPDGRRVGMGFRDANWPDAPTLDLLDAATGETPVYLISADVHSVWLNSAAHRREGFAPDASGIMREAPAFEISRRLNAAEPEAGDVLVSEMAARAAARGVVGIVDLDMGWNEEAWLRRLARGFDALRVEFGIYPHDLDRAIAGGLRTGDALRDSPADLVRVGPLKIITDGSLGTRTAACSQPYPHDPRDHGVLNVSGEELRGLLTDAAVAGLACAVHAIGDVANTQALDAFAATGAWGRIEHAQLVAHADLQRFGRLGVSASVQPVHALDDRDLADEIWVGQTAQPYPLRALVEGGANLMFGSDAPVATLDPWAAVAAAVFRTRDARAPWHPEQAIDVTTALAASTAGGSLSPSSVEPGARADLVLCAHDPRTAGEAELREMPVVTTLLGGCVTYAA